MLEIERLARMLAKAGIPFERNCTALLSSPPKYIHRLKYLHHHNCICSVIQGYGTCGHEYNLLEIMGLAPEKEDSVEGFLTAEEVFERIKKHWDETIGG